MDNDELDVGGVFEREVFRTRDQQRRLMDIAREINSEVPEPDRLTGKVVTITISDESVGVSVGKDYWVKRQSQSKSSQ